VVNSAEDMRTKNNEYLKLLKKIDNTRYSNLKRSGTIICRRCKLKSKTAFHIKHVAQQHQNLEGLCPFCQEERISWRDTDGGGGGVYGGNVDNRNNAVNSLKIAHTHLKRCCYFHKLENYKKQVFHKNVQDNMNLYKNNRIVKTSMWFVGMLNNEYCLLPTTRLYNLQMNKNIANTPANAVMVADNVTTTITHNNGDGHDNADFILKQMMVIPIADQPCFSSIQSIYRFHALQTLYNNDKYPIWLSVDRERSLSYLGRIVANNKFKFHATENIDCSLIRILSLDWSAFKVTQFTVDTRVFLQKISAIRKLIEDEKLVITGYMKVTKTNISFIVIEPQQQDEKNPMTQYHTVLERTIENLDMFIDTCYSLSNNGQDDMKFHENKCLLFDLIEHEKDILISREHRQISFNPSNKSPSESDVDGISKAIYLCPLGVHAKVYFYSQTERGCVAAFDRLLEDNNLATLYEHVLPTNRMDRFIIHYANISNDESKSFHVNMCDEQVFAGESYYMNNYNSIVTDDEEDGRLEKSFFILNGEHVKVVLLDKKADGKDFETSNGETTVLPECLSATGITYTLTRRQIEFYSLIQYHRQKVLADIGMQIKNI
jgi:hypothetical protein